MRALPSASPPPLDWRRYPLLRLLLPFLAGLCLADYLDSFLPPHAGAILGVGWLLLAALAYGQYAAATRLSGIFGLVLGLWLLAFGYWLAARADWRQQPGHYGRQLAALTTDSLRLQGMIVGIRPGASWWRFTLDVEALAAAERPSRPTHGRLLVYLPAAAAAANDPRCGDRLRLAGRPEPMAPPRNPAAFSFADYYHYQHIDFQLFLRDTMRWQLLPAAAQTLRARAERLRQQLLARLGQALDGETLAIGSALLLGWRGALDEDIRAVYAQTGAMHVLAVSGLHVGIVALVVRFALRILLRRRGRGVQVALSIAAVWGFAFITGLSPSVQRAAVMFSLLLTGQLWRRRTATFNLLAAAAFLLLLYDPYLLFQVGFQLSFAAVAGIVYFYPYLSRAIYLPYSWQRHLWSITAVGLAAQLGTLPFALYYFQQFPLYGWLMGVPVIWSATFILVAGLLYLALSPLQPIAAWVGWGLDAVIALQYEVLVAGSRWPGGVVDRIWLSPLLAACLLAVILALGGWLYYRSRRWLYGGLFLLIVGLTLRADSYRRAARQRLLTIYHIPRATVIDSWDGQRLHRISTLPADDRRLRYATDAWLTQRRTRDSLMAHPYRSETARAANWYYRHRQLGFFDRRLLLLDTGTQQLPPGRIDYLLVSQDGPEKAAPWLEELCPTLVVLDGSNRYATVERWREACAARGIHCHYTGSEGALVLTL